MSWGSSLTRSRKRAGRSLFIEVPIGIEGEQALHQIGGDVGLQAVDFRRASNHRELRDEPRARADASREEIDVAQVRRHSRRHVGGIEQRDPGAENIQR